MTILNGPESVDSLDPALTIARVRVAMTEIQIFYDGPIVKKADAKVQGLTRYFTGKPCKHGHVDQRSIDGHCISCNKAKRECPKFKAIKSEREKKRKSKPEVSERIKEYNKRYWSIPENKERASKNQKKRMDIPEVKKRHSDFMKEWYVENRDYRIKQNASWRDKNRDAMYEKNKEWRENNPERMREYWIRRRCSKSNAEGTHTADDVSSIYARQNGLCVYCDADLSLGYHVDHIMPIALGGSNWPDNLQCLCQKCNQSKNKSHPDDWHERIGRFDLIGLYG